MTGTANHTSADPVSGNLLDGRYRLHRVLGRGGMATVYDATDLRLERAVAVKVFHPQTDDFALARIEVEAALLAGMSHPALVRVFDLVTAGDSTAGRPYLVMERVNGETLRDRLNQGPLEPVEVAGLGARLAAALAHVHARDVVHRDLKPSNVLLDQAGNCYLADFGIARALGADRLTAAGQCVGTAAYLAPEQVAGAEIAPPADVYALGLVLLECLTGEVEYTGTDVEAAVARLTRAPRVPDTWGAAWQELLTSMTATDPADRPTAARSVELLTAAARFDRAQVTTTAPLPDESRGTITGVLPLSELPVPRRRRTNGAAVLAGAGAVAAAVATAIMFTSGAAEPASPPADSGQSPVVAEPAAPPSSTADTAEPGIPMVANPVPARPATGQAPAAGASQNSTGQNRAGANTVSQNDADPKAGKDAAESNGKGKGKGKGKG